MCTDSDYLMMNLINTEKHLNGWINQGELYGEPHPRRNSFVRWKSVVSDYEKFSSVVKERCVFPRRHFTCLLHFWEWILSNALYNPTAVGLRKAKTSECCIFHRQTAQKKNRLF